jgi:hypothetical protein
MNTTPSCRTARSETQICNKIQFSENALNPQKEIYPSFPMSNKTLKSPHRGETPLPIFMLEARDLATAAPLDKERKQRKKKEQR